MCLSFDELFRNNNIVIFSRYGAAYPAGIQPSQYAAYYDSAAAMASGMAFPPVRAYPDEWRGYAQPEGYPYDERDYEREVYRRDYDRRAPPTWT